MSTSLLESMLPFLVVAGFLGLLYLCAFGLLIVACNRLHRMEGFRAWQIACLATLAYAGLTCVQLLSAALTIYQ